MSRPGVTTFGAVQSRCCKRVTCPAPRIFTDTATHGRKNPDCKPREEKEQSIEIVNNISDLNNNVGADQNKLLLLLELLVLAKQKNVRKFPTRINIITRNGDCGNDCRSDAGSDAGSCFGGDDRSDIGSECGDCNNNGLLTSADVRSECGDSDCGPCGQGCTCANCTGSLDGDSDPFGDYDVDPNNYAQPSYTQPQIVPQFVPQVIPQAAPQVAPTIDYNQIINSPAMMSAMASAVSASFAANMPAQPSTADMVSAVVSAATSSVVSAATSSVVSAATSSVISSATSSVVDAATSSVIAAATPAVVTAAIAATPAPVVPTPVVADISSSNNISSSSIINLISDPVPAAPAAVPDAPVGIPPPVIRRASVNVIKRIVQAPSSASNSPETSVNGN